MTAHSGILAWRIPWTEEPGGLQSTRLQRVGHDLETSLSLSLVVQLVKICLQRRRPEFNPWVGKIPWERKWPPTPVSLPGESHGQRSLAGYGPQGRKSQTQPSD